MIDAAISLLDYNGVAAHADLEDERFAALFRFLEREQELFLAQQNSFRSDTYRWPLDALHRWSRVWEYPYVYACMSWWRGGWQGERHCSTQPRGGKHNPGACRSRSSRHSQR